MRITNIDTLSAYFDRLITERIKWYFFVKENDIKKIEHQEKVIYQILDRISELLREVYFSGTYQYLAERRTFNLDDMVKELDELIVSDIKIGEGDRARLAEIKKDHPDFMVILENEHFTRSANEARAKNKNNIDEILSDHFEDEK